MFSQKTGFTLVELIIVVAILSILSTLGFLAMKSFSQEAKVSKITTDISSIASSISNHEVKHNTPMSEYLRSGTSLVVSNGVSGNIGSGVTLSPSNYDVGYINYATLKTASNILDNNHREYVYAYGIDNDRKYFQIAGEISQQSGENKVFIKGNYAIENPYGYLSGLISASGSTTPLQNGDFITESLY